jgi:hypothetical protein
MPIGRYKKFALIVLLLTTFVSAFFLLKSQSGFDRNPLALLSEQDRSVMEQFFRKVIAQDGVGYTLFGDKPISLTGYFDPVPTENWQRTRGNTIVKSGWETWKRCYSQFAIKNYLFFEEPSDIEPDLKIVTLVNKQAFIDTVNAHREIFEQVLGGKVTGQELLAKLENHETDLFNLLQCHEGLYGILLGYGKKNAFLFQRRMDLNIYNPHPQFSLSSGVCGKEYCSLQEEISFLRDDLQVVAQNDLLSPIDLPIFLGVRESEESVALINQYHAVRKQLNTIFHQKEFLKQVFEQLMAENKK